MATLSIIDSVIVVVYLIGIFFVGIYAFIQRYGTKKSVQSYFLASRDIVWPAVGATVFSSNIGAEHFVGMAGTAAQSGIAISTYEWTAPPLIWLLGYFVCYIYIPSNIITTPQYLQNRYNKKIRIIVAIVTLLLFVLKTIATTIYSGCVILNQVLGWDIYTSSILLIIVTGIYVILGGLRAVVYTENIQTIILIIGGFIVFIYSINAVGGMDSLNNYYNSKGQHNMHLIRSYKDDEWPWIGLIFTPILQSYFYWCGNHLLIQRILSAKSELHAHYASIFTSILKILPVFMTVIPGMCAVVLYPDNFSNGTSSEYDAAYPLLVTNLLPNGIKGIVIAAMLSALMSSLAAVYNSASTIIMNDIFKLCYPNIENETTLINIGRFGAFIFIIISMLWLPIIVSTNSPIYVYVISIGATFQMPLSVVFFCGHFWNRANVFGAYCCLSVGFIIGLIRFISIYTFDKQICDQFIFCYINVLYFGLFSFIVSVLLMVVGSLLSKKPDITNIDGYTYWNRWNSNQIKKNESVIISETETTEIEMKNKKHMPFTPLVKHNRDENEIDKIPLITNDEVYSMDSTGIMNCAVFNVLRKFVMLDGDVNNKQWTIILHFMTFGSVIFTISMWIYFW
eukprot:352852_1